MTTDNKNMFLVSVQKAVGPSGKIKQGDCYSAVQTKGTANSKTNQQVIGKVFNPCRMLRSLKICRISVGMLYGMLLNRAQTLREAHY